MMRMIISNDSNNNNNNTINIYNNNDDYWLIMSSHLLCIWTAFLCLKICFVYFEHLYICELDFGSYYMLCLDETYVLTAV